MNAVVKPKIEAPGKRKIEEFFVYEVDFASLVTGSSASSNIAVEASSDFRWIKATYAANIATAAQLSGTIVIPLVSILITDSGSGQQLMSAACPITNIFGTGEIPFILPVSRIFQARSSINIAVANFSAATTYNLRLSFIGAKIYTFG